MNYQLAAGVTSLFSFFVFLYYMKLRLQYRGYIFSVFNYSFFLYTVLLFGSSLVAVYDDFWSSYDFMDSADILRLFNKSLFINQLGYCVLVLTLIKTEFAAYSDRSVSARLVRFVSDNINTTFVDAVFCISVSSWYLLVFAYNGSLPLLSATRMFYLGTEISPIYQGLNAMLFLLGMYYGTGAVRGQKTFFKLVTAVLTLAFTASRGYFMTILLFTFLYALYFHNKSRNFKWLTVKIVLGAVVVVFFAAFFENLRHGSEFDADAVMNEIVFGNTFSDIRDGAVILYGFENNVNESFLWGRSYLAGLISFIPSFISEYRFLWAFGRVTSTYLFGWEMHGGLRGGWGMEAYVNFGYSAVLVVSILQGYLLALLERFFYHSMLTSEGAFRPQGIFVWVILSDLLSSLTCTSEMAHFYVELFLVGIIFFISVMIRRYKRVLQKAGDLLRTSEEQYHC